MYDELVKWLREFADVINRANAQQNANENIVSEAADAIKDALYTPTPSCTFKAEEGE